jgi:DNA-binding NarL/FixJ family response regulator
MRRPTLLLADDHVVFTDAMRRMLDGRFEVVGAVTDGGALCDAVDRLRPDAVVTDISMSTLSGLEGLRQLRARRDATRVIFLTMHADPHLAAEAFRLGARGFVLKQSSGDELVHAIEAVLQGHKYISPVLTDDVLSLMATRDGDGHADSGLTLTSRQREVLRLIVNGQRMKEIAANLNLSPRTVETIKYEMMRDLDLHSTAELVRYALERRLVAY